MQMGNSQPPVLKNLRRDQRGGFWVLHCQARLKGRTKGEPSLERQVEGWGQPAKGTKQPWLLSLPAPLSQEQMV